MLQASVRAVVTLGGESHGSTVATTSAGLLVEGTTGVPGETQEDGAVAAIVVLVVLLEKLGDLVVHLLVVLLGGIEDLGRGNAALGVEVVTGSTCDGGAR